MSDLLILFGWNKLSLVTIIHILPRSHCWCSWQIRSENYKSPWAVKIFLRIYSDKMVHTKSLNLPQVQGVETICANLDFHLEASSSTWWDSFFPCISFGSCEIFRQFTLHQHDDAGSHRVWKIRFHQSKWLIFRVQPSIYQRYLMDFSPNGLLLYNLF